MSGELDPSAAVFTPMHLEDRQANAIESFRARCIATGSVSGESSLGTIFLFHKRESFLMFKDIVQHPDFSQGVETIVYCPSRFVNRPEHRNWLSHQCALAHNTALLFKPSIYTAQPHQALLDYDGVVSLQQTDAFRQFADMFLTEARSVCPKLNHVVLDCLVSNYNAIHNRRTAFKNLVLRSESSEH